MSRWAWVGLVVALGCDGNEKQKPFVVVSSSEITYQGKRVSTSAGLIADGVVLPEFHMRSDDAVNGRYVPRYVIDYDCARNKPDGTQWQRSTRFDLATKTRDVREGDVANGAAPPTSVVTKLTDERVTTINLAVLVVLSAPSRYVKPEEPGPGGIACVLAIRDPFGKQLELSKSDTKERDAASYLVKLLLASDE